MYPLLINLMIAVIWLLLGAARSVASFFIGFAFGFALLALFQKVIPSARYVNAVIGIIRFLLVFLREFLIANLDMVRVILFQSKDALHPNFVDLDVSDLKPWEIILLSYCIALTPGTTPVQISEDFRVLSIHAIDASDPELVRRQIKQTMKAAILGFSRA